jgi:hypothetical protein
MGMNSPWVVSITYTSSAGQTAYLRALTALQIGHAGDLWR